MHRNFPPHDRHPPRPFAPGLARTLSQAALAAVAPFVGLAFVVLLPIVGLVLLIAFASGAIGGAVTPGRAGATPSAPRCIRSALRP